jgi:hypothetical protein
MSKIKIKQNTPMTDPFSLLRSVTVRVVGGKRNQT